MCMSARSSATRSPVSYQLPAIRFPLPVLFATQADCCGFATGKGSYATTCPQAARSTSSWKLEAGSWHLSIRCFSRLQDQHVDAKRVDQLLETLRRAGQDREGAVVHRDDLADAEHLAGTRRRVGAHRVVIADREERDLGRVELGDQPHVAEERGVAGEVHAPTGLERDD